MQVVVLAGGYGGARMAHGFALEASRRAESPADGHEERLDVTVVGNIADDMELHGLHISPDLDTVMYTLAGLANPDTGWGVLDETWSASAMLERYGEPTWFRLGDRDLATHIVRTARLAGGARLTTVTHELCRALGVTTPLLPVTDDRLRTSVRTPDGWLEFQDYFVRRHHADEALEISFEGAPEARATSEVRFAIAQADAIVVAPSNPLVSVAPVLAVGGVLEALRASAAPVLAVSPIVGGAALRGPAGAMLTAQGYAASSAGVAMFYSDRYPGIIDVLALDVADAADAEQVRRAGMEPLVTETVISDEQQRIQLSRTLLSSAAERRRERSA